MGRPKAAPLVLRLYPNRDWTTGFYDLSRLGVSKPHPKDQPITRLVRSHTPSG